MGYQILTDACTGCGACESECPNKAITHKGKVFKINPDKCKDCKRDCDAPQCAEICQTGACVPVEQAA